MKISVITPTFNSEKTIVKNVESILKQSYKDFEHIIVDNLSSDSSLEIVKKLYKDSPSNLRIISEKDSGIAEAFNKGINSSIGEIIGILNSDDFYFSDDVFEKIISAFSEPKILFVHGNILFQDNLYGTNIRRPLLCDVRKAMPYNHPTMFLRKELYAKIGLFETHYKFAMDYDLVCRLKKEMKNLEVISTYLNGAPIVVMNAGGASWTNEIKSIHESKRILISNGFWDMNARINYLFRLFRTRVKKILNLIRMNFIVKEWRKRKWIT